MILLRCPKFLRCLTADAGNFDRGHSLTSLLLATGSAQFAPHIGPNRACTNFLVVRRGGRTCPPAGLVPHSRQGTRALPYKMLGCRAGPMCPAAHCTSCKNPVIAKPVTDVTGCGNPYCLKKAQRARFNPARCAELFIVKGNPVTSRCGCSAFPDSGKCWPPSCAAPWPRSSRSPSVKTRPCGPKSP